MIKFSHPGFYVGKFLARYRAWVEYRNLVGEHKPVATESGPDSDAVRVYQTYEIDQIPADPRPTVALDLREGLKETSTLNSSLPRDKHYIIFSGSRPNFVDRLEMDHTLICSDQLLADMYDLHLSSQSPYFYSSRDYDWNYPKSLTFVCYNGTSRPHRNQIAEWLPELPYSNFVYRLAQHDYGISADHLDVVNFKAVNTDIAQWFESQAQHTPVPHWHMMARIPTDMLNQAYFNLVLETDYEFESMYHTEKIIKPLMLGMPFVLASSVGHLSKLQELGFRTYNTLWDETYDTEPDKHKRLERVFDTVKQLGNFDWHSNRQQLEEIGKHNQANFLKLGGHFDREFREFERIIVEYERRH